MAVHHFLRKAHTHPRTSAPIWQAKGVASKPWILSMPVFPSISADQKASVPMPMAETGPSPVTTTCRVGQGIGAG